MNNMCDYDSWFIYGYVIVLPLVVMLFLFRHMLFSNATIQEMTSVFIYVSKHLKA